MRWVVATVAVGVLLAGCSSSSPAAPTPAAATTTAPSAAATTPPPTTSTPEPSVTPSCIDRVLGRMSPAERAGQLLMIGVPVGSADRRSIRASVRKYHLGGVFLAGNTGSGVRTIRSRTDALRAAAAGPAGLLISVDQEGGAVQRLTGNGFGSIPSAARQGRLDLQDLADATRTWASALHRAGISMDLAPVADTVPAGTEAQNPPIGAYGRQYGTDSATVGRAVGTVVLELAGQHVVPTLKHFPGLGRVHANTDTSTHAVDSTTTADDAYLRPFRAGIEAGAGAVMISSARYPKLDADDVAAFSRPVITGLLRERLGWDGVVISDDLGRARAVSAYPVGERATRFVAAGGDIVLSVTTADARPMARALIERAHSSEGFARTVDAAVRRVLALKQAYGLLDC